MLLPVLGLPVLHLLLLSPPTTALDNGLALTPPMGWLSWERYMCHVDCERDPDNCISEKLYMRMADALVKFGYKDAGYNFVNVDDCWSELERDAEGNLVPHRTRFPNGIKALADYVHSLGLKFGLYLDIGTKTCGGYPGFNVPSEGEVKGDEQYIKDVNLMAAWGIDSLKVDGCYADESTYHITYPRLGRALNATGRPMVYYCSWPDYVRMKGMDIPYDLLVEHCNVWRNYDDIVDSYQSVTSIINYWRNETGRQFEEFVNAARPGAWNDPDMLLIGNTGLSPSQSEMQMGMWAIFAAPLLMSNDLWNVDSRSRDILLNREVIAVNQDPLGRQGRCVRDYGKGRQVWIRELQGGCYAVALLNMYTAGPPFGIYFDAKQAGLKFLSFTVRDLLTHTDLGTHTSYFGARVQCSSIRLLKVTPTAPGPHTRLDGKIGKALRLVKGMMDEPDRV